MKKVSIVIPCYNEEQNIRETYTVIKNVMSSLPQYEYEIIFEDNDSKDSSQDILRELAAEDKNVKVILNNRNFGPDCSIYNVIISSTGDCSVFLTCDRQDPPEMIPEFLKEWENGAKVVWGQKTSSKESKFMFMVRGLYYRIIRKLSQVEQYSQVIGYGLYDREVIENLKMLKDPQPIIRNIIPILGYKPVLLPYKQNAREKGKTSNNFFTLVDYALNSLIHTSKAPMKIMIYSGMIAAFLSFLTGFVYFIYKITHWDTFSAGITPLLLMFSFIASVQIFFLGIIGEYLLSVLDRVSFYKNVVEKERINFNE